MFAWFRSTAIFLTAVTLFALLFVPDPSVEELHARLWGVWLASGVFLMLFGSILRLVTWVVEQFEGSS